MKKKLLAICIMLMTATALVACRDNEEVENPLIKETEIGVNLENKARDAVETQGEQAGESDAMLDSIPSD